MLAGGANVVPFETSETVTIEMLLDALAPERREAFVLTQIVGLPYAAAAEVCRVPIGTIRSRVARARDESAGVDAARGDRLILHIEGPRRACRRDPGSRVEWGSALDDPGRHYRVRRRLIARSGSTGRDRASVARVGKNGRDAFDLPRACRLLRGDPRRIGAVRPVVHARVLRFVVPVPAQRRSRAGDLFVARLPLHLASPPRSLRPGMARPPRRQARAGVAAGVRASPFLERELRAIGFRHFIQTRTRRARRSRRPVGDDPRVHDARPTVRSATRSSCSTTAPRGVEPERRPARRSRRAAQPRSVRRADRAVLGRDLVSDRVRLPAPR